MWMIQHSENGSKTARYRRSHYSRGPVDGAGNRRLDIGSSAVRAVELTVDERGIASVSAFGQVGLHEGLVVGGEVRESAEVGSSIRRLWQQGEFSEKRVHIGVAGLRVITRELDLPLVAPTELDSAVRYQAADVIPFPVEQSMTSAKVLQEFKSPDGAPMLRVLVAAAHRSVIDSVVEAVQAADSTQSASISTLPRLLGRFETMRCKVSKPWSRSARH